MPKDNMIYLRLIAALVLAGLIAFLAWLAAQHFCWFVAVLAATGVLLYGWDRALADESRYDDMDPWG